MFAENFSVFLQDMGISVTAGGRTFLMLFDAPDQTMNMAGVNVQSTMYSALGKTSDLAAASVVSGSAITINEGVFAGPYVVRDVLLEDDGAFTRLNISK